MTTVLPAEDELLGESQNLAVLRTGWRGERHVTPERELHSNLAVAVRELVETRAAKGKIPPRRLLSGNRRLTAVNLLILKRGF